MSDTAAAFCDVTSFDGRISLGDYRRILPALRALGDGLIASVAILAIGSVLVVGTTVAALKIANNAISAHPQLRTQAAMGLGALGQGTFALGQYGPILAAAPDAFPPAPVATDVAEGTESVRGAGESFGARWALASLPALEAAPVPVPLPTRAPPRPTQRENIKSIQLDQASSAQTTSMQLASLPPPVTVSPAPVKAAPEQATAMVPLPRPYPAVREAVRPPAEAPQQVAMVAPPPPPPVVEKPAVVQPVHNKGPELIERDARTAVYDISARTVYLPNGDKLEAHSGLGEKMDDPRYIHVRMRGATPPNVYKLTMREKLFHGVRAIRLNPVDEDKMHGRDGILAHTYMLGPNGQSNGCVSFKDYDKFLQAFLDGEVDRMVVVASMNGTPPALVARGKGRRDSGRYASASTGLFDRASAQAW